MRSSRLFSALAALFLVAVLATNASAWQTGGQGGGQGGGGGSAPPAGGGGTSPSTGGGTASPTPTRPGAQQPTFPTPGQDRQRESIFDMQRPIYLSGKVLTSDGTPPPELVTIEMVCGGAPRPQGYTDSKGRFSINLGNNNNVLPDASVGNPMDPFGGSSSRGSSGLPPGIGGVSERQLWNCELRAALPGYRSDVLALAGRRILDNPDVGTIILHRLGNVEGFTYSLTTANAPKDAKKAYERGSDRLKKEKYAEAEENLRKAVTAYPQYAIAWFDLGRALEQQQKMPEAKEAFAKAVEADPKYVSPYLHLMQHAAGNQEWDKLEKTTATILKLNPFNFPQAWFYNSVANLQLNKMDVAEKSAREALKLDDRHRFPKISHLLGVILAERRQYPEAVEHMKGYLMMAPNAGDAEAVRKQVVDLEKFLGTQQVGQAPTPAKPAPPPNN